MKEVNKTVSFAEAAQRYADIGSLIDKKDFEKYSRIPDVSKPEDFEKLEDAVRKHKDTVKEDKSFPVSDFVTAKDILVYLFNDMQNVIEMKAKDSGYNLDEKIERKAAECQVAEIAAGEVKIEEMNRLGAFKDNLMKGKLSFSGNKMAGYIGILSDGIEAQRVNSSSDELKSGFGELFSNLKQDFNKVFPANKPK